MRQLLLLDLDLTLKHTYFLLVGLLGVVHVGMVLRWMVLILLFLLLPRMVGHVGRSLERPGPSLGGPDRLVVRLDFRVQTLRVCLQRGRHTVYAIDAQLDALAGVGRVEELQQKLVPFQKPVGRVRLLKLVVMVGVSMLLLLVVLWLGSVHLGLATATASGCH